MDAIEANSRIWENIYGHGKGLLRYPSESLVRLTHGLLDPQKQAKVLDYGFGSAANLIHLAHRGFAMTGVEVSASAVEIAGRRCAQEGVKADLHLVSGGRLPFADASFDAVIAWQVLYYNTREGFRLAMQDIERVLRPQGVFIGTMAAVGDISHVQGQLVGDCEYVSGTPGQEGAHLLILDRADLQPCFPGRSIAVGEFDYQFGTMRSRHFIVTYAKPG